MKNIFFTLAILGSFSAAWAIDFTQYDGFMTCGDSNICSVCAPFRGDGSETACRQSLAGVQAEVKRNGYHVIGITPCHEYEPGSFVSRVDFYSY